MNDYQIMNERQHEEFNTLPIGAAFSSEQFEEMMKGWGLDANKDLDKIVHLVAGAYIQKKDLPAYKEMAKRQTKEFEDAIATDQTGEGFIYQMFLYELKNHEYGYTGDVEETLDALGYDADDIMKDTRLARGLEKAAAEIRNHDCFD
jgi:hypothetical protein